MIVSPGSTRLSASAGNDSSAVALPAEKLIVPVVAPAVVAAGLGGAQQAIAHRERVGGGAGAREAETAGRPLASSPLAMAVTDTWGAVLITGYEQAVR